MKTSGIFIGLGANLGDRAAAIAKAVERLDNFEDIAILRVSQLLSTTPWRVDDQPDFLNAVAEVSTLLAPMELLERLLEVEREIGRDRAQGTRWAARTIDLDLLLYRDQVIEMPGLRVPHPYLHEREFALAPLVEIAEDVSIPGRGLAREWLARVQDHARIATLRTAAAA